MERGKADRTVFFGNTGEMIFIKTCNWWQHMVILPSAGKGSIRANLRQITEAHKTAPSVLEHNYMEHSGIYYRLKTQHIKIKNLTKFYS